MVDSQKRGKKPEDDSYFALADHVIALAQAAIVQHDTSENHLYAGIGYALKTRLYGLRSEYRNAAKNGVASRTEFLRALELDPSNADASVGIGFYNYYVATLSPLVKVLSIFLGIPGGNKEEGIKQVQVGAEHGALLATDARFYQARNFRTYEQEYDEAQIFCDEGVNEGFERTRCAESECDRRQREHRHSAENRPPRPHASLPRSRRPFATPPGSAARVN
jgi:hypothetical protein